MKGKENDKRNLVVFDPISASILEGISSYHEEKSASKSASVKFMITMQDKENLRRLGYSQAQIDKLKPQEAETIIKAGIFTKPANRSER